MRNRLLHPTVSILAGLVSQAAPALAAPVDWPSYNRTLTSERYAPLDQIDTKNVAGLKVLCTFDTGEMTSFQTGLVQVGKALIGTTERDTFALDADTCSPIWRVHEEFESGYLKVNRGVAFLDGKLFRGTAQGNVVAYDAGTGAKLWETRIASGVGENVTAAPIAWNGLVFIGNAGGDNKGVKGRMYALETTTGAIVWEFYNVPRTADDVPRGPAAPGEPTAAAAASWGQGAAPPINGGGTWTSYSLDPARGLLYVPGGNPAPDFVKAHRPGDNLYTGSMIVLDAKTGAYQRHFQLVKRDFHDWDVAAAPALFTTTAGRRLMSVAPKDGFLYAIDLETNRQLYRLPMTTMTNTTKPLAPAGVRFCPGSQGGAEWNGPAYDPSHDLVLIGEVDWCVTVHTDNNAEVQSVALGQPWSGAAKDGFGKNDPVSRWAGWLTASDAVTGARRWRYKAPFPLMSGMTPTAGGLLFFGDMGGNFNAFETASGQSLWTTNLGGAVGGGVITYDTGAGQRVAVAIGMTSPIWPTPKVTAKVVVLGLP